MKKQNSYISEGCDGSEGLKDSVGSNLCVFQILNCRSKKFCNSEEANFSYDQM